MACTVCTNSVILYSVATLAQLVEHLIRNEKVASSILAGGSTSEYVTTSPDFRQSSGQKSGGASHSSSSRNSIQSLTLLGLEFRTRTKSGIKGFLKGRIYSGFSKLTKGKREAKR